MIGDRLEAIDVAVGRNWFKRLASFIEHSSSNLRGGGERSGSLQEIRKNLFINSILAEQEIAKPRKINALAILQREQNRKGEFPFPNVRAKCFAGFFLGAGQIKAVIVNLVGSPNSEAEIF